MVAEDPTLPAVDALGETVQHGEPRDPARELVRGDSVGRFLVLSRLGQGGMGVVYAAFDPELDRKVAVKLLLPERDGGAYAQTRMLREAQAMARLAHPNVVTVHDVGARGDRVWIAMEHVGGQTLTRWLAVQRRSWRHIIDVFAQAGEGLRAAHAAGLVHRDFKPDNVMIDDDGRARVMDFGLARAGATAPASNPVQPEDPRLTQAGAVSGTPRYMAPEQWQGHVADAQADQFAFCVALWEALYGQPPFYGNSVAELMWKVLAGEIRTPVNRSAIPWWLRRTLRRGLSVAPAQRWPSMAVLLAALDRRPRQRRLTAGLVLLAGLSGAAAFTLRADVDPCAGAGEPIARLWDPQRAAAVEAAFHRTDLVYANDTWARVAPDLDEYTRSWTAETTNICRSDDESGARELVHLCLERRRVEFRALVDVLAAATPEVVEHARQAVRRLTPPGECRDTRLAELEASLPLPADPLAIGALRERLSRVTAQESAGQYDAALNDAVALQAEAEAAGYLPLIAEAALRRGTILAHLSRFAAADEALVAAIAAADASGHDLARAEAMVARIEVLGVRLARPDLMQSWIPMTEALVSRVAPNSALAAMMWTHAGTVADEGYRFEESEAQHRRALALLERISTDDDPVRITVLFNLGYALRAQERRSEALTVFAEAEALTKRVLGPEHPALVTIYNALGNSQIDPALASEYYEKVRALGERVFGPRSPMVAAAVGNLAEIQMFYGDGVLARDNFARAVDIISDTYDDSHPKMAEYLLGLAQAELRIGEIAAARATFARIEAIYDRHPWTPNAALAISGLATTYAREHRWEEARAYYHRANELMADRTRAEPQHLDEALRGEANALLELGRPAEALELARSVTANPKRFTRRALGMTRFVVARAHLALGDRSAAFAEAETALVELSTEHFDAGPTTAEIEAWLATVHTAADPPRPPRTLR